MTEDTFYSRLLKESEELDKRITKLGEFIKSSASNLLNIEDKVDLEEQHGAMINYGGVLHRRIKRLKPKPLNQEK